jgi:hypothetical protein
MGELDSRMAQRKGSVASAGLAVGPQKHALRVALVDQLGHTFPRSQKTTFPLECRAPLDDRSIGSVLSAGGYYTPGRRRAQIEMVVLKAESWEWRIPVAVPIAFFPR